MTLLLDAGVWVAFADPEDRFNAAAADIVGGDSDLAALDLSYFEVANAVGVRNRLPNQARELARLIDHRCRDRLVRVSSESIDALLRVADVTGLTAYDAAYVAAARRFGWTLVSTDVKDLVAKGLAVAPDAAL